MQLPLAARCVRAGQRRGKGLTIADAVVARTPAGQGGTGGPSRGRPVGPALSTVNQAAFVDQDFPDLHRILLPGRRFRQHRPVEHPNILVPGDGWNGFSTLFNATP